MSWIAENMQILATLGSATAVYWLLKHASKKEADALSIKIDAIDKKVDKMEYKVENIEKEVASINLRLTKLEGCFEERKYWMIIKQEAIDSGSKS